MRKTALLLGLWLALGVAGPVLAAPNTGASPVRDCPGVPRTCGAWGPKGQNTCRTCQQAQCKVENGRDVIAGNKTQTECYQGQGRPPPERRGAAPGGRPQAPAGVAR